MRRLYTLAAAQHLVKSCVESVSKQKARLTR